MQYDSTKLSSNQPLVLAQDFVRELALFLQDEGLYQAFAQNQPVFVKQDVRSAAEREKAQLLFLISIFVGVMLFVVGQSLSNFALDAYVGERERGTYDSIRLSGMEIFRFILGKTAFTILAGLLSGILLTATVLFGHWCFNGGLETAHYVDNVLMMAITFIITGCISLAMLAAALIHLSTYFERVRDAAAYATIITLVFALLSQVSSIFDHEILAYLPVFNMNQMIVRNAHGSASLLPLITSVILGSVFVAALTQGSVVRLKRRER